MILIVSSETLLFPFMITLFITSALMVLEENDKNKTKEYISVFYSYFKRIFSKL